MTRISENQQFRRLVDQVLQNKQQVDRFGYEVSSGLKVSQPGDSSVSGTIERFRQSLDNIDGYRTVISETRSSLEFQDSIMNQMNELMIRLKEVATQAANETLSPANRSQMSEEVFQIRDHIATLANTTYQGRYLYGGAADNTPPYYEGTTTQYTNPVTSVVPPPPEKVHWIFDAATPGRTTTRTVQITDDLSIVANTVASDVFDTAMQAAETLGRSMKGYATGTPPAGNAYVFPDDYSQQTLDIKAAMDQLDVARTTQIIPERTELGGKLRRIESAESLLEITKTTSQDVLARLQNVDEAEAASGLALAQTALQASYTVTAKLLNQSILDFI